jgi:MFS family permease
VTILRIVLLAFFVHLGFAGSRLVVPLFAIDQGATPFVTGTIISLYAALPAVLALPAGRMTDRLGFRAPLLFGSLGVFAALLTPVVWPSMRTLYLTASLLGLAFMVSQVAIQTLAGAVADGADRARNFSLLSLGYASANFTGPLMTGMLIDQIGHQLTFLALSAPLVPAVLIPLLGRSWLPRKPTKSAPVHGGALQLLRIKALRDTLIASGIVSVAWDVYQFFMPIYGRSLALSATAIGTIMSAFAIAIVGVRVLIPFAVKLTGEAQMLTYAMFVACAAFCLFPACSSAIALAGVSFVLGIGCGCGQPLSMTMVYNASPKGRAGEAAGMRITVNQIAHFVIPIAFGAVGSAAGYAAVFFTNAAFLASGGYVSYRSHPNRTREKDLST